MKLILAVVRDIDTENILKILLEKGYQVTRLASSGGFLRKGSTTLMIGIDDGKEKEVIELLKSAVGTPDPDQHRVTLFVLNATDFEQI